MFSDLPLFDLLIFIGLLFLSVSLHEMTHAYVAYRLGDDLAHSHGRISLNPLRHIDPLLTILLPAMMIIIGLPPILAAKPVPINTSRISGDELGLAAVGIAGPVTNLLLATLGALIINFIATDVGLIRDIVYLFVELNVALFVFNMMPLPPLDGSRLLYAFAPPAVQRVMEQIEQLGMFMIIFILVFLLRVIGPILQSSNEFILRLLIN